MSAVMSAVMKAVIKAVKGVAKAAPRRFGAIWVTLLAGWAAAASGQTGASGSPAGITWVAIGPVAGEAALPRFDIARTETTVGQFRRFAEATATVTRAERAGGGEVYESGWVRKPGWTWRTPFGGGRAAGDDEPAVHVTFDEAAAFCRWAGARLPSDGEWLAAAYVESRVSPPAPFVRGRRYAFPTGDGPAGAQCLDDCGAQAKARVVPHGAALQRGHGHALAGSTPAGVNGLHEMGGNVWEWVDEPAGATVAGAADERRTRGGSWWYGAAQMRADHLQAKARDTAVVYIGFRCARDARDARDAR
jgi:formylglycine-generating enzyme required for sulfatase activity